LNEGDVTRAMIAAIYLRLPEVGAEGAARLAAVDAALRKYSEAEPRDWHGRWTTGGAAGGPNPLGSGHSGRHLVDVSTGGEDDDGEAAGIGDNMGPSLKPIGPTGEAPPQDPTLPTPKVPSGWDHPARVENGQQRARERVPLLRNGQPWPTAQPYVVLQTLQPGRTATPVPTMKVFVPTDGEGPILVGSGPEGSYEKPPGYDEVTLYGTPQRTVSRGADTGHGLGSAEAALDMARTNKYSDIFFNRSFSRISNGEYKTPLRPDVVGRLRPSLDPGRGYDVHEVLSPGQSGPPREQQLRDVVPAIGSFNSRAYKLLLKLLRALGIS
jgi:hypothetical protein